MKSHLPDLDGDAEVPMVSPERLAVLCRSLRKALEDAKNEPGAGVFYYGEMEARRQSASTLPRNRALLTMYWAISGYGQGAGRALVALVSHGWAVRGQPPSGPSDHAVFVDLFR